MKKSALLCSLFLSVLACAQNWKPVQSGDTYLYYLENHGFDSTAICIEADSMRVNGLDTLVFLNRKLTPEPSVTNTFRRNVPNFLMRSVLYRADGSFMCSDTNTTVFLPFQSQGIPWTYDSLNNITATIISVGTRTLFSTIDSVKIIALSTGDSVVLSKNFGIVKHAVAGAQYSLVGITGRGAGIQIPGSQSVYYVQQPGDIFVYDTYYHYFQWPNNNPVNGDCWSECYDSLVSKTIIGSTIELYYIRTRVDSCVTINGTSISWHQTNYTRYLSNDSADGMNRARNNTVSGHNLDPVGITQTHVTFRYNNVPDSVQYVSFDTSAVFQCRTMEFQRNFVHPNYSGGEMVPFSYTWSLSAAVYQYGTFGDSVGIIYIEQTYYTVMQATTYSETLRYAKIGGVEYGVSDFPTSAPAQLSAQSRARQAFPNPVSDVLFFDHANQRSGYVTVVDCFGKVQLQADGSTGQIDVSSLAPGLYFLDLGDGVISRFVKH